MEKRRELRITKRVPVRFTYDGQSFQSVTGDISRRGVFIRTANPFPCRSGIDVEIQCCAKLVQMTGFIIWSKRASPDSYLIYKGGMGVQLLDYQKQEYQALLAESG